MPSTAITARNAALRISTASGAAKTLTAATKANPCEVSSTAHALTEGTLVLIDGVVGMTELNGRVFIVSNPTANAFELLGVDSTNYTTYVSGGEATPQTMTKVGSVRDFSLDQDEPQNIDVTNLDSTRQEFRIGLPGSWSGTFNYDVDTADAGQTAFQTAMNDGLARTFSITLSNGKIFAGSGYVMSCSGQGSPNAVVGGSTRVRGTGQYNWFV